MIITYHKEIGKTTKVVNTILHTILSNEVKAFIKEHNVEQERYYFYDNGFYWFIYLDNGDRIDIQL